MKNGGFEEAIGAREGFPPVLLIEFEENDQVYKTIKEQLDKEMFLRVRVVGSKLSHIIINSVSDIEKLDKEEEPSINLEVNIGKVEQSILTKINNSPMWVISLVSPTEYTTIAVEKGSELILKRKVEKI